MNERPSVPTVAGDWERELSDDICPELDAQHDQAWAEARSRELSACLRADKGSSDGAPSRWSCVLAGALVWLVTLSLAVGFTSFGFLEMPCKSNLAIELQVLGNAVAHFWFAARSRSPEILLQASPIPAIAYSEFMRQMRLKGLDEEEQVSTLLCFIWLSTIAVGTVLVLCAECRLGTVLQYFPRSVATGYVGGVGFVVLNASLSMLAGVNPMQNRAEFFSRERLLLVLPGVLLAALVYPLSCTKRCSGPVFKVLPMLAVVAGFHAVLHCLGTSLEEARSGGWLFPNQPRARPTDALTSFHLPEVDWELLWEEGSTLVLLMCFLCVVAHYSSVGGILTRLRGSTRDADAETWQTGWANLLTGLMGGMPSFPGMVPSAVCASVVGPGGGGGLCAVVCGLMHLALFCSGVPLISLLPKCSIAGCLLIPSAVGMIQTALFDSLPLCTSTDYVVIWVISCTVVVMGIQNGLLMGFVLNAVHMLVQCAHLDVVSSWDSLRAIRTVKDRNQWTHSFLTRHGQEAIAFHLKGVLWFGNCVQLEQTLAQIVEVDEEAGGFTASLLSREVISSLHPHKPPKFLVLDFAEVVSVDSSAWEILAKASERAQAVAATDVLLCGLGESLLRALASQGERLRSRLRLDFARDGCLHVMEQLEDQILQTASVQPQELRGGWDFLAARVATSMPDPAADLTQRLSRYFERCTHSAGELLAAEGDEATASFWIESGEFHCFSHPQGVAKALLYRKATRTSVVGFETLCHEPAAGHMPRWTSIKCERDGTIFRLSRTSFEQLRAEDPALCLAVVLSAASQREVLLRQLCRYRFAPQEIELQDKPLSGGGKPPLGGDGEKRSSEGTLSERPQMARSRDSLCRLARLRTSVLRALQAKLLHVPSQVAEFV